MARKFPGTSGNYLVTNRVPGLWRRPFTIGTWQKLSGTNNQSIVSFTGGSTWTGAYAVSAGTNSSKNGSVDNTSFDLESVLSNVSTIKWEFVAYIWTATEHYSLRGGQNGSEGLHRTSTKLNDGFTGTPPDEISLGIAPPKTSQFYSGELEHILLWEHTELTEAEVDSIAWGANMHDIRPEQLVIHFPLVGADLSNHAPINRWPLVLKEVGSVAISAGPNRTAYFSRPIVNITAPAAAGGVTVPLFHYHQRYHNRAA